MMKKKGQNVVVTEVCGRTAAAFKGYIPVQRKPAIIFCIVIPRYQA